MILANIRADLATALKQLGYNAFSFVPEDPKVLPAAVAGVPTALRYAVTSTLTEATLPVTLYFSAADLEDGQQRMDAALSSGANATASVRDTLVAFPNASWKSIQVTGAGNVRIVSIGSARALACDVTLVLMA